MPKYVYECTKHKHQHTIEHKMGETYEGEACIKCGDPVKRVYHGQTMTPIWNTSKPTDYTR